MNYGLLHRHFGTKDGLVVRLFREFSDYGDSLMRDSDAIYTALRQASMPNRVRSPRSLPGRARRARRDHLGGGRAATGGA